MRVDVILKESSSLRSPVAFSTVGICITPSFSIPQPSSHKRTFLSNMVNRTLKFITGPSLTIKLMLVSDRGRHRHPEQRLPCKQRSSIPRETAFSNFCALSSERFTYLCDDFLSFGKELKP